MKINLDLVELKRFETEMKIVMEVIEKLKKEDV